MNTSDQEVNSAILEMRELLRLLAEPAIAARDKKQRTEIRQLVGKSSPKIKAALLMRGDKLQSDIVRDTGIDKGQLSSFVKQLLAQGLLRGDTKMPTLTISLPERFFEEAADDE